MSVSEQFQRDAQLEAALREGEPANPQLQRGEWVVVASQPHLFFKHCGQVTGHRHIRGRRLYRVCTPTQDFEAFAADLRRL